MDTRFKAKIGRLGVVPTFLYGKQLDAGITASATVQIPIGTPFRKLLVVRFSMTNSAAASGSSTITGTLQKKPVGAGAVALSTAANIKTLLNGAAVIIPLLAITDPQQIINEGDSLYVDVTAAGTVTSQPIGLYFVVEALVLE